MYTTKSGIRGVVAIGVVALMAGSGIAAPRDESRMSDQPSSLRQQTDQPMSSMATDSSLRRTSQLIGQPVTNAQGERLGTIYDVVLTEDLGEIDYVALSRGGIFGIGRNLYAIPWSSMRLGATGAYVAPISENELTQWRGFRPSAWPRQPSKSWIRGAASTTEESQTSEERRSVQARRFTRIRGTSVETPEGLNAGNIRDLVVAMDSGDVRYTIVSFGGLLGIGSQFAAVPQDAINLDTDQRVAQVDVGREVLRDNAFAAGRFPDLGDPSYARNINQAYGTQAGETVLGYVPAEGAAHDTTTHGRTRQESAGRPDHTGGAPVGGELAAIRIDPQAKYDPAAARTVEGVVTGVSKSARTGSEPDILLLQVRTDAGDTVHVHAGPLNYVSRQDFYAVSGDRVSVTGSPVQSFGHSVILAAQISKDGQVLTLRNRDGQPVWESRAGSSQQGSGATDSSSQDDGKGFSPGEETGQGNETPAP